VKEIEPPIDRKLLWQGRKVEVGCIRHAVVQNMYYHSISTSTKQMYTCVLVSGASGVGKSRLCYEAYKDIRDDFANLVLPKGMIRREWE
jgi:hypothetical protein